MGKAAIKSGVTEAGGIVGAAGIGAPEISSTRENIMVLADKPDHDEKSTVIKGKRGVKLVSTG